VVQRGFGGSQLSDVVYYSPRIVLLYRPRLIVLYAGDNDIAAGKSPATVVRDYRAFVALVRRALPETRIAFISIKPSPSVGARVIPRLNRVAYAIRRRGRCGLTSRYPASYSVSLRSVIYSAWWGAGHC
jgi:lysophospholipase L1-like esterase